MKPKIVITIGDPAGVGPEVTLKALADAEVRDLAEWHVVGDRAVLDSTAEALGLERTETPVIDLGLLEGKTVVTGELSADCGRAAVGFVRHAAEMCAAGDADAMVTAPLNKESVAMGGMKFSGHTEFIAEITKAKESRMLLVSERLRVVHVTTHVPLRIACESTMERVLRTIELGAEALQWIGTEQKRIAVCGLNPHAGEHGLFGSEDRDTIVPAVEQARKQGIDCYGPIPADTVFLKALRGNYELVVAMYHDQGHIPLKLIDFEKTVNVSIGLPIIRTSVDHGTAFDIAGKGMADAQNMKAAMQLASVMAANRIAG